MQKSSCPFPRRRAFTTFATFFGMVLLAYGNAFSQPANEPLPDFITTDGSVFALAETNNTLYLGGAFTSVGLRTGGGVPVDMLGGEAEAVYPKFDGTVRTAVGDGSGGWFVGGTFTLVGGTIRSNLVHIRSDRTVNPTWNPSVSGEYVHTLWLTNNTLYLGGAFTNVNGQTRNHLAALDSSSGLLKEWNPNANNTVLAMAVYGAEVYMGGLFSSVAGQTRNRIAAVDRDSGAVTTWNPGVAGPSSHVAALCVSGGRLFAGGYFSSMGGQSRGNAASVDLATGGVEGWNPNIATENFLPPTVSALAVDEHAVFLGGTFSKAGSSNRVNIAAVDAATGLATSWDAHADPLLSGGFPTAQVAGLAVWNGVVYVGGILGTIGGEARGHAAALDSTTGDALPWNPEPNGIILTLHGSGSSIYLGGHFGTLAGSPRTNLAAFNLSTKQITPWNPTADGNVLALSAVSDNMFVGGEFANVNGTPRSNLVSVDLATGALSDWAPNPNSFVMSLARWQDRLFVAGGFTEIGGLVRTNLAEIDLATGSATAWDPGINPAAVRTLAVSDNILYAGGFISTAQGQARRRIAAFDLTTGLLTPWDPNLSSSGLSLVEAIEPVGNVIYLGGRFVGVGGQNRTNFAAVDAATAAVLPMEAHTDRPVTGLATTTNQVFIGGDFSLVNGQKRSRLASLSVATGELTAWDPSADFLDQRIYIFDDVLYPVGVFLRIGGQTSRGIAAFPLTAGMPTIVKDSERVTSNGGFQFQVEVPGAARVTVETTTNFLVWDFMQTLDLVGGYGTFTDSGRTNSSSGFYRLMLP